MVTVVMPVAPWPIVSAVGASEKRVARGGLTVRVSGVERLPGLPVPPTVQSVDPGRHGGPDTHGEGRVGPGGRRWLNDPVTPLGALPKNSTSPRR